MATLQRRAKLIGIAALVALAVLSLGANSKEERPTIKIGVMLCLTGDCAEWGTNALKGAQLAAQQINAEGGILGRNVKLVVQDSHDTTPSDTVAAFKKLRLDNDIQYFLGPTWTVGGMPLAPLVARKSDIVVTSPSVGVRDFNETASNILNVWPHDEIATRKLAQFALGKGYRRAAIFGSEDPWVRTQSDTFEEEFKKGGGEIVVRVEPLPGNRSLKAEALKIRRSKPDVVFFSNYQADVFAKELRVQKLNVPKLSILMEKERVKSAAGALEDTVFALYEDPEEGFKNSFEKKFGVVPGITADTAYDVLKLYAKAMTEANTTSVDKVLPKLLGAKKFRGASGVFSMNNKGAVDKQPVLWRVKGLDYVLVSESPNTLAVK